MGYLFSAYLILWGVTFGYLFMLGARQKRLERELELLRQEHQISVAPTQDTS